MELRIFTEPQQGASHATLVAAAQTARTHGFGAFFRSDHVLSMGSTSGLPGPSDSMVSLAAIAAQVPDIRLGTLVTSATFRHPGMLAIAAANVDDISGGRLELGMGAGWFENEHTAYGLPFGASFGERFDRLTEQLEILTGLWSATAPFHHHGRHYQLAGAPGLPKPVQRAADGTPHIPLIIGGHGPKRTPALAARFAAEFNIGFVGPDEVRASIERVEAACRAIDRDPDTLVCSTAQGTFLGRGDVLERRMTAAGRDPAEAAGLPMAGSIEKLLDGLAAFAEAGVQRTYLQVLDLTDLDHIAELGALIAPAAVL